MRARQFEADAMTAEPAQRARYGRCAGPNIRNERAALDRQRAQPEDRARYLNNFEPENRFESFVDDAM